MLRPYSDNTRHIDHLDITKTDVSYLGELIGNPVTDRIIAVSTSAVFNDKSLTKIFWDIEDSAIDNGIQGHLYTRPNDTLVIRAPYNNDFTAQTVITTIGVNYEIWKSLTGIELLPQSGRIVITTDRAPQSNICLTENITCYAGSLLDAATTRYRATKETFLAFVFNKQLADSLGLQQQVTAELLEQARTTSQLMNKNNAMQILQNNGVDCAMTYSLADSSNLTRALSDMPSSRRYVFKPAGGAAGIGVFSNNGNGAEIDLINSYLEKLKRNLQLPRQFQIQQFLSGPLNGISACFDGNGDFEIFEIHRQIISKTGRFIGGRWAPDLQAEQMEIADKLCRQIAAIKQPVFRGLICLDIIDKKVIEINPRLTASAPIAHILRQQTKISRHLNSDFKIKQIDLNTKLHIPYDFIKNGALYCLIKDTWKQRSVLVLPQGLNPFGDSRLVFINDDSDGTVQNRFIQQIEN